MVKVSRLKKDLKKIEGSIIKNVRNVFRLKEEIDNTTVKEIRKWSNWKYNNYRYEKPTSAWRRLL